jgi:ABC-type phosphate/phosphonate transport system ATPase subunit
MSNLIAIVGSSGSGKSTSIRTLDPKETFIINIASKPLPFKGWRSKYTI